MCGVDTIYCPGAHIQLLRLRTEIFMETADGVTEAGVDQGRFKEDKIFFTR